MVYSPADFSFFEVTTRELNNLIVATHALEHLRERYFPWGAGNQLEPNKITNGEIRYREWAVRSTSSPFYNHTLWRTTGLSGESGKDRQLLNDCARCREKVLLAKGGACQECADTTFDYVRTRPFDDEYRYVHRASWGGAHEYVLLGGISAQKLSMKKYIMIDPWTTSPQVCWFEHSHWYSSYKSPIPRKTTGHHRFVIDMKAQICRQIRQVDEYAKTSLQKKQLLIKALKEAKKHFYKEIPLTWMCLKCGEHLSENQIKSDKAYCHGCNAKVYSYRVKDSLIDVFKKNKDEYLMNRKQFEIDFQDKYPGTEPKVMPLIEDPEQPYEYIRKKVGTGKFFKEKEITKMVRTIGKPKVKIIRPGPPKDKKTTKIWGEEIWGHKYCTAEKFKKKRVAYYDNVRFNKEAATKFWGEHIDKCKLKQKYTPLVDK